MHICEKKILCALSKEHFCDLYFKAFHDSVEVNFKKYNANPSCSTGGFTCTYQL